MDTFSVYNYENLSDILKLDFNKSLAQRLSLLLNEIKEDDISISFLIEEFIETSEKCLDVSLVSDIYSKVSACIQAGSGNQILSLVILNAYTECWGEINEKL